MTTHEQKAQELAERCAKKIHEAIYNTYTEDAQIILRELSLAKLVEDSAMIDLLETKFPVPKEFKVAWIKVTLGKGNNDVRTAIRTAMKEDAQ